MSLPEIPADVAASVKRLFRSEKRKAIAMELLYFEHWPTVEEKQRIAATHELHITSVDQTLYILRDADFFTKKQGSIPLYRVKLGEEVDAPDIQDRQDSEDELLDNGILFDSDSDNKENDTDSKEGKERDLQDNRLKKIEVTVHNQGERIENFMAEMRTTINQLGVASPKNNPGPEALVQEEPASVEERLELIERQIQEGSGGDPFDNLSREQIIELIRSQPQELMTMANPDGKGMVGRVEGQSVTLRPMILMLTTYSQMLYERAVYDGHFEGTLSDFANFTMEQYFTDRGWGLDWNKREPANLRRHG